MSCPTQHATLLLWLLLCCGAAPIGAQEKALELGIPLGHRSYISGMQVLPDGTLITTDGGNILYQWSLEEKRLLKRHYVHEDFSINTVTGDGLLIEQFQLEENNYLIRLFDPATGIGRTTSVNYGPSPHILTISRDGAYYGEDGKLKPLFPEDGLEEADLGLPSLHFDVTGSVLLWDNPETFQEEIWSYPEGEMIKDNNYYEYMDETETIYIINNGDFLAGTVPKDLEQEVIFFKAFTGKSSGRMTIPSNCQALSYNEPSHSALVLCPDNGGQQVVHRYDLQRQQLDAPLAPLPGVAGSTGMMSVMPEFSRDGKTIVSAGYDGSIYLYDAATGQVSDSLVPHVNGIASIQLARDGTGLLINTFKNIDEEEFSPLTWDWYEDNTLRVPEAGEDPDAFQDKFFQLNDDENFLRTLAADSHLAGALRRMQGPVVTNEPESENAEYRCELLDEERQAPNHCLFEIVRRLPNGREKRKRVSVFLDNPLAVGDPSDYEFYEDDYLAVGTYGGTLLLFDLDGKLLFSRQLHDGPITDLAVTADGGRLLSAGTDGGIYIMDATTREPIAALYLMDEDDWVVIGRDNRFDASSRAMSKLYYKMHDTDGEVEIVELSQMKDRFYDPGLLQKILGFSSVPKRNTTQLDQVKLYPEASLALTGDRLDVTLTPRAGGIGRVAFFVNDKGLEEDINPGRATSFSVDLKKYQRFFLHDNVISLQLYNEEETLRSAPEEITYVYPEGARTRGTSTTSRVSELSREEFLEAKLYVVAVGSSDYTEGTAKSLDLSFPDRDAEAMSLALLSTGCELFCTKGEVEVTCLTTDAQAPPKLAAENRVTWRPSTKANVEQALKDLRTKARPQDIVVVYFSGHGKTYRANGKDQFHYLTREVSPDNVGNAAAITNAVISSEEMTALMTEIPAGKQVLILDACQSGQAIDDIAGADKQLNSSQILALTRMSDRTGLYLLTGSAADMVSFEANKYGQGLLTYALLKGMSGSALTQDQHRTLLVGVTELFEYAQREVVDLATNINGIQKPQINYPRKAGSFPLGIVNERVKELVGAEKTIISPPSFQEATTFADDLYLEDKLADLLREEAGEGSDAEYLYQRQKNFPGSFSVRGQYSKNPEDGTITLRANLLRKGSAPIPLVDRNGNNLTAKTADRLVEKIEAAMRRAL